MTEGDLQSVLVWNELIDYFTMMDYLLDMQRNTAKKNSVIMDGRDIGTVILPDAEVKIFLFAFTESQAE